MIRISILYIIHTYIYTQYEIHNSYIWEQIHIFGNIKVGKISTKQNSADLQTKVLGAEPFKQHSRTIMGEGREFKVNLMVYYSQLNSN